MDRLREAFGVYLVRSGRMSVAGLNSGNVELALAACSDDTSIVDDFPPPADGGSSTPTNFSFGDSTCRRSRRRMILPARFLGIEGRNAISFGATAAPRRFIVCTPRSKLWRRSAGTDGPLRAGVQPLQAAGSLLSTRFSGAAKSAGGMCAAG